MSADPGSEQGLRPRFVLLFCIYTTDPHTEAKESADQHGAHTDWLTLNIGGRSFTTTRCLYSLSVTFQRWYSQIVHIQRSAITLKPMTVESPHYSQSSAVKTLILAFMWTLLDTNHLTRRPLRTKNTPNCT